MNPLRFLSAFALAFALLVLPAWAQNATLVGTVTDAENGDPMPGANVVVMQSGSATIVGGSGTSNDGTYRISGLSAGMYTVAVRFIGFQEYTSDVTLAAGQTVTLNVALEQGGFDLNTVVVTASRQQEKVLDAPASVSVLSPEEIQQTVSPSAVSALRNTTGVDIAQTGVDRQEVVLRGFNNAFSTSTYSLVDYRQASVPALAVNLWSIMPITSLDIERVEVVRGPGSALYGAGVDAGVIHFLTKDPFTHTGTTVALTGGTRSTFGAQFRHATALSDKLAFKVVGEYLSANDWEMNFGDPEDAAYLRDDVAARDYDYEKYKVNGEIQYRLADDVTLAANLGTSALTAVVLSGIGTLQADGIGYSYGQLRLQAGNLFAQVYANTNDAGDSFVYAQDFNGDNVPDPVVDKGRMINAQAQYDMALGSRQQLIVGVDYEQIRPDTEGTINGRNEDDDTITEAGIYAQSTTNLTEQFDLTLALRGDYNNIVEQFQLSPRAAVVFKPNTTNTFRATFNRAFSSPGSNSNFLDIGVQAGGVTVRNRGSAFGFNFERNPAFAGIAGTDLVATSLVPSTLGAPTPAGLPLDAIYGSVYGGLAAIPNAQLTALLQAQGLPVNEQVTAGLVQLLNPAVTQVQGFSQGVLAILSTTGGAPTIVSDVSDIPALEQTTSTTFEVGYKGIINDKLLLAVDGYYVNQKNFVGPLLMESPAVLVPNLSSDLTAALVAGIQGNAQLAGTLANFGLSPQQVAGLIVNLAGDQLPSASTPIAIVQPTQNNPGVGRAPELLQAYRNFGDVDYYGVDVTAQLLLNDDLNVFGNVSVVSDDFFDAEELGEENEDLALALNAPKFKAKGGFDYKFTNALSVNASGRYVEGFPVRSGPYIGDLDSYFLVDLGAGYDLSQYANGLRVDVQISNLLDTDHRQFIGAPSMGRMAMARVTFGF
ncbi:MAG: hypothetical protein RhofKO_16980 [Rhodothermales bacterium]